MITTRYDPEKKFMQMKKKWWVAVSITPCCAIKWQEVNSERLGLKIGAEISLRIFSQITKLSWQFCMILDTSCAC